MNSIPITGRVVAIARVLIGPSCAPCFGSDILAVHELPLDRLLYRRVVSGRKCPICSSKTC